MNLKTTAAAAYATLQALHDAASPLQDAELDAALTAHHEALNEVRKLFAEWPDFLAFIGAEPEAAKSGGGSKDPPKGGE